MGDENKNNVDTRPPDLIAGKDTVLNAKDPLTSQSNVMVQKKIEGNGGPPLPAIIFDTPLAGTGDMVAIARQAAVDVVRQIRIDGQPAQMSGGTIDFTTNSQKESAQSQWVGQNWSNLGDSGGYITAAAPPFSSFSQPLLSDTSSSLVLPAPVSLAQEYAGSAANEPLPVSSPEPSTQPTPSSSAPTTSTTETPKVEASTPSTPAPTPAPTASPNTVGYSAVEVPKENSTAAPTPTADAPKGEPAKVEGPKESSGPSGSTEKKSGYKTDDSAHIDGNHTVQYGSYKTEKQQQNDHKPVEAKAPEAPPEGQIIHFEMPDGTKIQARITQVDKGDQGAAQGVPPQEGASEKKPNITQPNYDSGAHIDGGHEIQYGPHSGTKQKGETAEQPSPKEPPAKEEPPTQPAQQPKETPIEPAGPPAPPAFVGPPAPEAPPEPLAPSKGSEGSGSPEGSGPSESSSYVIPLMFQEPSGGADTSAPSGGSESTSLNPAQSAEVTNTVNSTYKENIAISTQIPLYIKNTKTNRTKVVFLVLQHHLDLTAGTPPTGELTNTNDSQDKLQDDEYYVSGGGGASGTFLASYDKDKNETSVSGGYYGILNDFTYVGEIKGSGQHAYAIIEHSNAGVFSSFKIEISSSTKDPTNLDGTGKFVKFSNVLLASKDGETMKQYRTGNFVLIHQVINGKLCLWPYSTGGSA